ncbi:hypothetical protein STEG23_037469 [Scotinomys teguina]
MVLESPGHKLPLLPHRSDSWTLVQLLVLDLRINLHPSLDKGLMTTGDPVSWTPERTTERGCMTQLYFFCFFAISECYVLTAMAYDRYVAICNPLMYNVAMSPKVCSYLMIGSYLMGVFDAMIHTGCILRLTFCDGNTINHYFCDLLPLMKLSCTSTYVNEIEIFIVGGKDITVPSIVIFISYGFIVSSILQIKSTAGRSKAFSTCSSHIIAVSLFFGSCAFMYLKPSSIGSLNEGKVSSVFYNIVVPMMNPLIYSLRNKDVKVALRKTLNRREF